MPAVTVNAAAALLAAALVAVLASAGVVDAAKEYTYVATQLNYADAEAHCASNFAGGHLASPNSAQEWTDLQAAVQATAGCAGDTCTYYLGINDIAVEGDYVLANGDALTFAPIPWGPSDPDGGAQDCLWSLAGYGSSNNWVDVDCVVNTMSFVCEYEACDASDTFFVPSLDAFVSTTQAPGATLLVTINGVPHYSVPDPHADLSC